MATQTCVTSCGRFDKGDPRILACENFCRRTASACEAAASGRGPAETTPRRSTPPVRTFAKKIEVVRERENYARLNEAISRGNLADIRRLIEAEGLSPTYVYVYDYNAQTRLYEGRVVRLRLTDIFNDVNELRSEERGLDRVLALFIELGMDVTATLDVPPAAEGASSTNAPRARTAWGPSLKAMERARDRTARLRTFDLALQKGLKPNEDISQWLFAELPEVCGRDRSAFAIQVTDMLINHLGTSLQDAFWRAGQRGPETVADVLDRLMSPGAIPRSNYERTQFAMMDSVWENCSPLQRRINRYLMQGN